MTSTFRVLIQPEAYDGLEAAYNYIEANTPGNARKWVAGLMSAIESLDMFPTRCPLAPEDEFFKQEIRQLIYGSGLYGYRILFTISGNVVSVLHIRHSAQDTLQPESGD